jgi:DNA-binding CsgD family transcriptional regulator
MLTRSNHPAERICVHLLATDPELVPSAVSTLRTAASDALSSGAPEIAVDLLTRALAEPTDAETRADLLYDRGFARLSKPGFDPDAVKDIETAIGMTHDPRRKAERALTACRSIGNRGVFGSAFDVCKIGLEGVASTDDPIIVRLLTEAITLSRNAPATADAAAGYRTLLRSARRASGLAPFFDIEQAWELATEGRDADLVRALVLRALDGGLLQFGASPGSQGISFFCLMWTDEPQVVEALTTEALAARSRSGSPDFLSLYSGVCLMWRAVAGCYAGSLRRAEADAAVVVEQNARFEPLRSNGFPPAAYVHALVERGRLDEAAIVLQRAGLDADLPDSFEHLLVLDSRARLRIARHDRARAAADLRQCERITNAIGMANPACCPWRSQLALVLSSLGEHDEAVSLAREEVARARAFGANRALGIALRAWAQVGEAGERLELLREAVAVLDGSPARLEHARAMVDLGRALRQAGERSEAQQQLRRAMDLAERCGASPLAERAREELVVAGARPRRRRTSGSDALTAGERRVAEMAAAGMTNREIAQALFITTKTVAHHLTHIYAKLEIDGRQSLAAALSTDA